MEGPIRGASGAALDYSKIIRHQAGRPLQVQALLCLLIVAVIVLLLIVVVMIGRRKKRASEREAAGEREIDLIASTSRFHAVSIRPGPDACHAARGLVGQRFLSDAAPSIPLSGCDSQNCRCRFVHFSDRRSGDDRRSPFPAAIGIDTGTYRKEQRQSGDRRKNPSL